MNESMHKHMARVFLAQAKAMRVTGRSNQRFYWTLLEWAANRRRQAQHEPGQRELFA